ncbi:hypothetical protein F0562_007779 [Nyssa sinensis]|uniref:Uncharacterized protein n=1 Tax=Nyssa sinensis TaxID=561372 RepID=A0A5J5AA00_9ASTE|nr:hypothetical protein F0562_007779 [Nyssa sinensis]
MNDDNLTPMATRLGSRFCSSMLNDTQIYLRALALSHPYQCQPLCSCFGALRRWPCSCGAELRRRDLLIGVHRLW